VITLWLFKLSFTQKKIYIYIEVFFTRLLWKFIVRCSLCYRWITLPSWVPQFSTRHGSEVAPLATFLHGPLWSGPNKQVLLLFLFFYSLFFIFHSFLLFFFSILFFNMNINVMWKVFLKKIYFTWTILKNEHSGYLNNFSKEH
jgi:hypothetical protein